MLTAEESKKKADVVRAYLQLMLVDQGESEADTADTVVTCENCCCNDNCDFVWDLYNTDGDCLAIK